MLDHRRNTRLLQHDLRRARRGTDRDSCATADRGRARRTRRGGAGGTREDLDLVAPQADWYCRSQIDKRISHSHGTVQAPVLKVFGEDFAQSIVLGVGPQVGVVPGEPVCSHSEKSGRKICSLG